MKKFHEQIPSFGLIKMKKNYSTNILVNRKLNGKKEINNSQKEIKNNTINKSLIKRNLLTSKTNFNKKNTIYKNDKFSSLHSIGLISPNFNIENKPSEYFSLKKKNDEIINEISNYKLKIQLIDKQIIELKNYINKKNLENINDNTIKSLNVTITEDNIKNNNE